ncbi:hypothetical protein HMPREF9413_2575 [Paenibacillus sp. HGF7]|nr:hypothetical protein HMPREF9413_2575 [Paenibacillus sp. HGF7]
MRLKAQKLHKYTGFMPYIRFKKHFHKASCIKEAISVY